MVWSVFFGPIVSSNTNDHPNGPQSQKCHVTVSASSKLHRAVVNSPNTLPQYDVRRPISDSVLSSLASNALISFHSDTHRFLVSK